MFLLTDGAVTNTQSVINCIKKNENTSIKAVSDCYGYGWCLRGMRGKDAEH